MALDEKLLEIIVCPKCKGDLIYEPEKERLICKNCSVYYPIKDDIPILLIEEAIPIEEKKRYSNE
ncbi:MAG: Trm112 family protein [Thermodesulfovibrio sp.]|nr:Trm112 family protein [Thermodesulfovibrio sp.]